MYLYYNSKGVLLEKISETPLRQGNNNVNTMYIFIEPSQPLQADTTNSKHMSDVVKHGSICTRYQQIAANSEPTIEYMFEGNTYVKQVEIPYDRKRDLKFFQYYTTYEMYCIPMPSGQEVWQDSSEHPIIADNIFNNNDLQTEWAVEIRVQYSGEPVLSYLSLGVLTLTIEGNVCIHDTSISTSQYDYLLWMLTKANNIFWATYGETDYSTIETAVEIKKLPVCLYEGLLYTYATNNDSTIKFFALNDGIQYSLSVSESGWTHASTLIDQAVFWVDFGTTTQSEIETALSVGKLPLCKAGGYLYTYVGKLVSNDIIFSSVASNIIFELKLTSANEWSASSKELQEKLVSGTSIKTINGVNILDSGNLNTYPSLSGNARKVLKVNADGNNIEWGDESNIIVFDSSLSIATIKTNLNNGYNAVSSDGTNIKQQILNGDYDSLIENGSFATTISTFVSVGFGYIVLLKDTTYTFFPSADFPIGTMLVNVREGYPDWVYTSSHVFRAVEGYVGDKQDALVSGVNIKTINGNSLLGSGDITISSSVGISLVVVSSVSDLPSTGADSTIYLVPNGGIIPNYYDEYIWTGTTYERIGTTQVDLTNYYTKTETDTKLATKQNTIEVNPTASSTNNPLERLKINDVDYTINGIVYWATYGTTTYSQLTVARYFRLDVACFYNNKLYRLVNEISNQTTALFSCIIDNVEYQLECDSSSNWTATTKASAKSSAVVLLNSALTLATIKDNISNHSYTAIDGNGTDISTGVVGGLYDSLYRNASFDSSLSVFSINNGLIVTLKDSTTYLFTSTLGLDIGTLIIVTNITSNPDWVYSGQYSTQAYFVAINSYIEGKQDTLVSGTNIKTINNSSILGSGNIDTKELPTLTGNAGKVLKVNSGATDVEWGSGSGIRLYKHTLNLGSSYPYAMIISTDNSHINYNATMGGFIAYGDILSVAFWDDYNGGLYDCLLIDVTAHSRSEYIFSKVAYVDYAGTVQVKTIPTNADDSVVEL